MRWEEFRMGKPLPGAPDLTKIEGWRTQYKGYGYVITRDGTVAGAGFNVSARPLGGTETQQQWLAGPDPLDGEPTWTAAEALCRRHAQGRRDA